MKKKSITYFKVSEKFQNNSSGIKYNYCYDLPTILHSHEYFEIFVTLEGTVTHMYNGKPYEVEKGCVVLVKPDDTHRILPSAKDDAPAKHFNMSIRNDVFSFLSGIIMYNLLRKIENNKNHLCFKMTDVEFKYFTSRLQYLSICKNQELASRLKLLALLCLDIINQSVIDVEIPAWLSDFLEKINMPEYFVLPINKLYKLVPYSQPQFSLLFKKYLHTTLTAYITAVRLDYACTLLSHNDFSILKVSELAGFMSLSNFNHVFKKHKKITPSAYKKQSIPPPPKKISPIKHVLTREFPLFVNRTKILDFSTTFPQKVVGF